MAAAPNVVLDTARTGPNLEREGCLRVEIRPAIDVECGDLRIVHPLPTTRTYTKDRTPVLLYNSRFATPYGRVVALIQLPSGTPDNVVTTLYVDGSPSAVGYRSWAGSAWGPDGGARRIALNWNTTGYGTGIHKYRLDVYATYGGQASPTTSVYGELAVVNRTNSWFGAGWWIAGWESLSFVRDGTSRILWIGGDGSTRVYSPVASNTWRSVGVASVDTITYDGTYYNRHLPGFDGNRARVMFDGFGRHYQTIDRLGRATIFGQDNTDASRVATIVLPYGSGQNVSYSMYWFGYDGNNKLSNVAAPPMNGGQNSKQTYVTVSNGNVQSITAPDQSQETFAYGAGFAPSQITGRVDQRGTTTSLVLGQAGTFSYAATYFSNGYGVGKGMQFDDELVGSWNYNNNALPPAQAVTTYTDQRKYTTTFALDGHYQPTAIRNAAGEPTQVAYDRTWPGRVASVVHPNGFTQLAFYNARGLTDSTADVNPFGDGHNAVTKYQWDPVFPFWTQITSPTGVVQQRAFYSLDGGRDGNLNWFQTGTDPSRRSYVSYNSLSLPQWVKGPADASNAVSLDSMWYDANGNLSDYHRTGVTATHIWNYYDGVPFRTYTKLDPADNNWANWRQATTWRNLSTLRVDSTTTAGPARNGAPAETLRVATTYANDGLPLTVIRRSAPDPNATGAITTQYQYDDLGRRIAEIAPDGQTERTAYDDADNPTSVTSRRSAEFKGAPITMQYDALNRVSQRVLPSVYDSLRYAGVATQVGTEPMYPRYVSAAANQTPNGSGGRHGTYTIPGEAQTFTYDVTGGIKTAVNRDAQVTRRYYPNGAVAAESLVVRATFDSTFPHSYLTSYAYDLDGRSAQITYPAQISPGGNATSVSFTYDPTTGLLAYVNGMLSARFLHTYDKRGQLSSLVRGLYQPGMPGNVYPQSTEWWTYTPDGQVSADTLTGQTGSFWRAATFSRLATGQLSGMTNTAGLNDAQTASYDGLGQTVRTSYTANASNFFGGSAVTTTVTKPTPDALGNMASDETDETTSVRNYYDYVNNYWMSGDLPNGRSDRLLGYTYDQTTYSGRLLKRQTLTTNPTTGAQTVGADFYTYDQAGNVVFETESRTGGVTDRASFYGADGTLRAADYRAIAFASGTSQYKAVFEEYRYDALGRRVWVRARRQCSNQKLVTPPPSSTYSANGECSLSTVRRTVWDGTQEIGEIQTPGADTTSGVSAGQTGSAAQIAQMEQDSGPLATQPRLDSQDPVNDPNLFFGRVAYTFGLWSDRPLGVTRMGGVSAGPAGSRVDLPDAVLVPLWNERGQVEAGYAATNNCASSRCYPFDAPAGWFPYNRRWFTPQVWHGSLLADKEDKAGTLYRRNRYYDPASGRFTQEDPIGLAGGANLYGFAAGDPVNYSDPFGLCPPQDHNYTTCTGFWTVTGAMTGALIGGTGGGAGGALAGAGVWAIPGAGVGAMEGAALGARAGAFVDGLVFASKQARAVSQAGSLVDNITGHLGTVAEDPNADDANHHRGEIRGWVDRIEKYTRDMKGKTQEEWTRRVEEWRKQLNDLTPK